MTQPAGNQSFLSRPSQRRSEGRPHEGRSRYFSAGFQPSLSMENSVNPRPRNHSRAPAWVIRIWRVSVKNAVALSCQSAGGAAASLGVKLARVRRREVPVTSRRVLSIRTPNNSHASRKPIPRESRRYCTASPCLPQPRHQKRPPRSCGQTRKRSLPPQNAQRPAHSPPFVAAVFFSWIPSFSIRSRMFISFKLLIILYITISMGHKKYMPPLYGQNFRNNRNISYNYL